MDATILHLIGQMERGGTERQLLYLAQELKERGWRQVVVTFNPGDTWDNKFTEIGVPLYGIPRRQNKLGRLWQLSQIVRQEHPALIHSWSGHTNIYAHWVLNYPRPRRLLAFRYIPTVDSFSGKPVTRVKSAGIYQKADCVVSNSQAALDHAQAAGVNIRRSEVVNNIIPAYKRARPGETVTVPRIVAAGALIPVKAYDVLLEALADLASAGYQFELVLAGHGSERSRLEELTGRFGLYEKVKFLGGVDDVPSLFATAHLLVHPSRSEGLSNTILEAMAEGLPVVATSVGGTPELITHEKNGLLVPPDQPLMLAKSIRQLLDDPKMREEIGSAGYELVIERCSAEGIAGQYERIYESIGIG
jgi:glycosyltransferase involved in cell wall biosynthesis